MNWINKFRFNNLLLFIVVLICLTLKGQHGHAQTNMALKDDHIEILIEIDGQNIQNARDKENPIESKVTVEFVKLDQKKLKA